MKDFKRYFVLNASPEEVYNALTLPHTIQLWSGDVAEMTTEPGSEFSLWDGSICGKNLEFEINKKIIQEWYFGETEEPSIVTIKLHPDNKGTSVEIRHVNIPDDAYDEISDGWNNVYIASLIDFYLPD